MTEKHALTLVYTDVVRSTEMAESLGEGAAHRLLLAHRGLIERTVRDHGGLVAQDLGDGFQLVFDDASAAVSCAIAVQRELEPPADASPPPAIRIRIGIHSGDVLREGGRFMGRAAITAQRVMSMANGREILISAATQRLANKIASARVVERGRFRLKGLREPVPLYEVIWRSEDIGACGGLEPVVPGGWRSEARDSPFVGRDWELERLEAALAETTSGRSHIVAIAGPAGIGKTRLVSEFLRSVSKRRLVVLTGRFSEGPARPFAAWAECMAAALQLPAPPSLPKDLARELAPLVAVVPALRQAVPRRRAQPLREAREARRRLVEALTQLWIEWSRDRTLVLFFDDLQWADSHSLELLQAVARRLTVRAQPTDTHLLILCTLRDAEPEAITPYGPQFVQLRREHCVLELTLRGLEPRDSEVLCRGVAGAPSDPELRARIGRKSGGNPLFIEELSQAHASDPSSVGGLLAPEHLGRAEDGQVPIRIQDVIERRLSLLSRPCLDALHMAALMGDGFRLPVLAAALRSEIGAIVMAVDEAWRARVLTEYKAAGELHYAFEHALIAECLCARQSAARRQQAHLRIAEALSTVTPVGEGSNVREMAFHLMRAGRFADPAQLAEFAERAGEQASAVFAFPEAADLFGAALEAYEGTENPRPVHAARIRTRLSWALGRMGEVGRARDIADVAIETLESAGEVQLAVEARLASAAMLGLHAMHREALPYLEAALRATRTTGGAIHGEALARYAIALDQTGSPQPMLSIARRLRRLARRINSAELDERAGNVQRNWYVNHTPHFSRALRVTADLARSADLRRDPWYGAMYRNEVAFLLFLSGRVAEAQSMAQTALERAVSTGTAAEVLNARALRALTCCFRGDWAELDTEWSLAAPDLGRVPGALRVGLLLWARRQADTWLGRPEVRAPSPARIYRGLGLAELAVASSTALLAVQRDAPGAGSLLGEVQARLPREGGGLLWLIAAQGVAAGLAALGRGDTASDLYEGLLPYAGTFYLTSTALELGRIARLLGWTQRGLKHLNVSIRHARRERLLPILAFALHEKALLLEAKGATSAAKAAALESRTLRESLGIRAESRRAS